MIKVDVGLYRGQRPHTFQELKDAGILSVINLQSGTHEIFNNDKYEKENPEDFGIIEQKIPLSDFFPPTMAQWYKILLALSQLPAPVYIHCLHGKDRTGFICAIYRMRILGWRFVEAKSEMFGMGFHKFPYIWWIPFLRKFRIRND